MKKSHCTYPDCRKKGQIGVHEAGKDHLLCEKHWGDLHGKDKGLVRETREALGILARGDGILAEEKPAPKAKTDKAGQAKDSPHTCSCRACKEGVTVWLPPKDLKFCERYWKWYISRNTYNFHRVMVLASREKEDPKVLEPPAKGKITTEEVAQAAAELNVEEVARKHSNKPVDIHGKTEDDYKEQPTPDAKAKTIP